MNEAKVITRHLSPEAEEAEAIIRQPTPEARWCLHARLNGRQLVRVLTSREELTAACRPLPASWSGRGRVPDIGARLAVLVGDAESGVARIPCRVCGYLIDYGRISLLVRPHDPPASWLKEVAENPVDLFPVGCLHIQAGEVHGDVFADDATWLANCSRRLPEGT